LLGRKSKESIGNGQLTVGKREGNGDKPAVSGYRLPGLNASMSAIIQPVIDL
jgi:hypothetical protein